MQKDRRSPLGLSGFRLLPSCKFVWDNIGPQTSYSIMEPIPPPPPFPQTFNIQEITYSSLHSSITYHQWPKIILWLRE